jgi:hypothetical protein
VGRRFEPVWAHSLGTSSPKIHFCLVAMSGQVLALLVTLMPNVNSSLNGWRTHAISSKVDFMAYLSPND